MDLNAVCAATGIEPSRVRYFEKEFGEFLVSQSGPAEGDTYDAHSIALFTQINAWMFEEWKTVFDIRQELVRLSQAPGEVLRIIAVTSGKGGVGKTTVALNLSIAIAARGARTLLIDADMGMANVHVLAGLQPRGTILDVVEQGAEIQQILADGPGGVKVLCGASGIPELADLEARKLDHLLDSVARLAGQFNVVVIDTAAGISSQVTRFLGIADDIVVVTTPNIAATLDAYGVIKVVREAEMPGRLHVVVNLVSSNAQATGVYERLRDCAKRFLNHAPTHLGQLQKHGSVERANQNRRPLMLEAPDSLNAHRVQQMADDLLAEPALAVAAHARPLPLDLFVRGMTGEARRAG